MITKFSDVFAELKAKGVCKKLVVAWGVDEHSIEAAYKAVEMGLNALMIRSFRRDALKQSLLLPLEPVAAGAVAASVEGTSVAGAAVTFSVGCSVGCAGSLVAVPPSGVGILFTKLNV